MSNSVNSTFCFDLERLREALLSPLSEYLDMLRKELTAAKTELKTEVENARNNLAAQLTSVQSVLSQELAESHNTLNLELLAIKEKLTPMALNIEQLQTELTDVKNTVNPIPSEIQNVRMELAVIKGMLEQIQGSASRTGLKSVQRGTLTMGDKEKTKDVAITPVSPAKAFLSVSVASDSQDRGGNNYQDGVKNGATAFLSAPDKLTFSRATGAFNNPNACTIAWEVIEFY